MPVFFKIVGMVVGITLFTWGFVLCFKFLQITMGTGFTMLSIIVFPLWLFIPFYDVYLYGNFMMLFVMYGGAFMGFVIYLFGAALDRDNML